MDIKSLILNNDKNLVVFKFMKLDIDKLKNYILIPKIEQKQYTHDGL